MSSFVEVSVVVLYYDKDKQDNVIQTLQEYFEGIEYPPSSYPYDELEYSAHKEAWESAIGVSNQEINLSGDIEEEELREISKELKEAGGLDTRVGMFIRWIEECPTTLIEV